MMKKFIKILASYTVCSVYSLCAQAEVKLTDYQGFQNKWPLITVRFREDSGEMRFTWGNEKGMKGLEAGKGVYEDGSVFAKVSFKSEEDPSFISSKVPSGARRVQLMIRDAKKYAETDGWGYFLFDSNGKSVQTNEQACAACHRVVPDRGYVFSQKVALANLFEKPTSLLPIAVTDSSVVFENAAFNSVPVQLRKYIPRGVDKKMRKLVQPWFKAAFEGTADEIRPLLTKEAIKSSKPAYYISADQKVFSFVSKYKTERKCSDKQVSMKAIIVFVPSMSDDKTEIRSRELDYCATAGV